MERLYWDEYTWPEIEELLKKEPLVILPVGSVEEHGHHLPLNTDLLQPLYLAEKLARELNALILPPVAYGWTMTMMGFPGTISLRFETLRALIYDILKGAVQHGAKKFLVISGHASSNHMCALRLACEEIIKEHPEVQIMLLSDYHIAYKYRGTIVPEDDSHAGVLETSRIMAIRPELVHEGKMKYSKKEYVPYSIITDYREIFPYGTMSNPEGANAELGKEINEKIYHELLDLIKTKFHL